MKDVQHKQIGRALSCRMSVPVPWQKNKGGARDQTHPDWAVWHFKGAHILHDGTELALNVYAYTISSKSLLRNLRSIREEC